jgi:hypothetical protein
MSFLLTFLLLLIRHNKQIVQLRLDYIDCINGTITFSIEAQASFVPHSSLRQFRLKQFVSKYNESFTILNLEFLKYENELG